MIEGATIEVLNGQPAFVSASGQSLAECVAELFDVSFRIYSYILEQADRLGPLTIVCGGQSPAYYGLTILNSLYYDSSKAEILVLPYSRGAFLDQPYDANSNYNKLLSDNGVKLRKHVFILDSVRSGIGINGLTEVLRQYSPRSIPHKVSIDTRNDMAMISDVEKSFTAESHTSFADRFPRLVPSFRPKHFNKTPNIFSTSFNTSGKLAKVIISLAHHISLAGEKVESTQWFQANHMPPLEERVERLKRAQPQQREENELKAQGGTFKPIELQNDRGERVLKCPSCSLVSGTSCTLFHTYNCPSRHQVASEVRGTIM